MEPRAADMLAAFVDLLRRVVLCDDDLLQPADFPQILSALGVPEGAAGGLNGAPVGDSLSAIDPGGAIRTLADVEGDMIRMAVTRYHGQMSEVARRLGIGRSTLYRKVRDLGIPFREGS